MVTNSLDDQIATLKDVENRIQNKIKKTHFL